MDALTAWFRRWSHDAPATLSFAAIACLLWLATAVESRSFQHSLHDSRIGDHAILYGSAMPSDPFGPLRALSAIFLHLSISHLFVNLFLLMLIGRELERFYGHRLFAALFLIGGLGSSAAILWMAPTTPTAGASGAVYALMVVLVGLAAITKADLRAPPDPPAGQHRLHLHRQLRLAVGPPRRRAHRVPPGCRPDPPQPQNLSRRAEHSHPRCDPLPMLQPRLVAECFPRDRALNAAQKFLFTRAEDNHA